MDIYVVNQEIANMYADLERQELKKANRKGRIGKGS